MPRYVNPVPVVLDVNGKPVVGAKLYFYEPGTTTQKSVYSDSGFTTAISQPVLTTSGGLAPDIYIDGLYKVVLTDEDDVTLWTRDPIGDVSSGQLELWDVGKSFPTPPIVTGKHYFV